MKIPVLKRLNREEVDAPGWFDKVLSVLNMFMERVVMALSGRLTFGDNFLCEIKTLELTHGTETKLATGLTTVLGAFPVLTNQDTGTDDILVGFKVRNIQSKTIGVTALFNGGAATIKNVKFIIIGG